MDLKRRLGSDPIADDRRASAREIGFWRLLGSWLRGSNPKLPQMMIRVFVSQDADLLAAHLSEEVVDQIRVVKVLVGLEQGDPFGLFGLQVAGGCFYLELLGGGDVFVKGFFVFDHAFQRDLSKDLTEPFLTVGMGVCPENPSIPVGIVSNHLEDVHLSPFSFIFFIDSINSFNELRSDALFENCLHRLKRFKQTTILLS